ncbi:UNKNOWN [Stylonychia lemnae]|uniref:Uncharacterized protein n=1 Tax=Stylonychia lemnae TaxID=5949 RepID=A0A078A2C0_STYLE|nr:UNKNOWN [Stylonychia lemnae]|eukprot:CDW75967.1 UNKNOWN [Stylonychia lemnae]
MKQSPVQQNLEISFEKPKTVTFSEFVTDNQQDLESSFDQKKDTTYLHNLVSFHKRQSSQQSVGDHSKYSDILNLQLVLEDSLANPAFKKQIELSGSVSPLQDEFPSQYLEPVKTEEFIQKPLPIQSTYKVYMDMSTQTEITQNMIGSAEFRSVPVRENGQDSIILKKRPQTPFNHRRERLDEKVTNLKNDQQNRNIAREEAITKQRSIESQSFTLRQKLCRILDESGNMNSPIKKSQHYLNQLKVLSRNQPLFNSNQRSSFKVNSSIHINHAEKSDKSQISPKRATISTLNKDLKQSQIPQKPANLNQRPQTARQGCQEKHSTQQLTIENIGILNPKLLKSSQLFKRCQESFKQKCPNQIKQSQSPAKQQLSQRLEDIKKKYGCKHSRNLTNLDSANLGCDRSPKKEYWQYLSQNSNSAQSKSKMQMFKTKYGYSENQIRSKKDDDELYQFKLNFDIFGIKHK